MGPLKKRSRRELSPIESIVQDLQEKVASFSSSSDHDPWPLQQQFLELKALQRQIMTEHANATMKNTDSSKKYTQELAQLTALHYEKAHLLQQIQVCRHFSTPHLEMIAHAEAGSIQEYLGDVQDPAQKQTIIDKLHREIKIRGDLESEIKTKEQQLDDVQKDLSEKEKFLHNLPDQVDRLEKASLNLQKFVHQHSTNPSNHQIGSDRAHRIELARKLPTPLYTLFQNLQHEIDQEQPTDASLSVKNEEVTLKLPLPKSKHVSIHFQMNDGVVTAKASGAHTVLRQDILLEELFPNDTPSEKGAYHWCNLISGILPAGNTIRASTRVILRELRQRVASNATLKSILSSWERKIWISTESDSWKPDNVIWDSFSIDESDVRKVRGTIIFQKGSESLEAGFTVDLAAYPARPPTWTLNREDKYEEKLAMWETKVNLDLIQKNADSSDQEAFDWIIVKQLQVLLRKWSGEDIDDAVRPYRGRNRVPNDPMETD